MARRHLAGMIRPASGKKLPEEAEQVATIKLANSGSSKSINANSAWHDVFEMCKKGFQTKMHSMGEDILQDVRTEVTNSNSMFRLELTDMLEARQKQVDGSIRQILQKVDELQMTIAKDASETDLDAVLQEVHSLDRASSQANQSVAETLETIKGSIQEVYVRFELEDEHLQKLVERQDVVEALLIGISRTQEALPSFPERLADEVAALKEQIRRECEQLGATIRQDLSQQLEERVQLTEDNEVDLSEVIKESKRTQKTVDNNMRMLLNEIGKIQQALHLDFVQLEEKVKEDMRKQSFSGPEGAFLRRSSIDSAGFAAKVSKRRFREIWAQTDCLNETVEAATQTDAVKTEKKVKRKNVVTATRSQKKGGSDDEDERGRNKIGSAGTSAFLHDAEALKAKARAALVKPQYNLFDHYKTEGCFQGIAKSSYFDNLTLVVVCINALWLAVEADNSDASMWIYAEIQFKVAEHLFCAYFIVELFIRFVAFAEKRSCLRDKWFLFDSSLLVLMVVAGLEIQDAASLDWLRLVRIVKILRLSRMAKLLRALPELMIIVKGIGFAARSVIVFFVLWIIIIYPFSVLLRQLTAGNEVGEKYFRSVPDSMSTLFLHGIVPNQAAMIQEMGNEHPILYLLLLVFYLLASVTIMYMLVGVLVDVMGVISKTEQEGMTVSYVSSQLRAEMANLDYNADETELTQLMLQKLLVEPAIAMVLGDIGVDVLGLLESLDVIYEDMHTRGETMTFETLIELVLSMRGSNMATVKDVREQLRVMKAIIHDTTSISTKNIREDLAMISANVRFLQEEALKRDQDDSDAASDWDPNAET
eukprot:TRINITY_DN20542_c0_g1_i2.p1 TRINITY_DN20542_c0_g1~~TRINITY_DN20542_c0_g1_i2.p1  ORF type:complete len:820 (+),score=197.95 TRINITY_DN20542_c0_g1_i2:44-2503(+)